MRGLEVVYVCGALAGVACSAPVDRSTLMNEPRGGTTTAADAAAPEVSNVAVLSAVAEQAYATSADFAKVSTPYPSSVATGSNVAEWVSADAVAAYATISPDKSGTRVSVPAGTIIVRAVENAAGVVTKLTLMVKGPAGYNPAIGDWWFGVTDPNGVPQWNDAGVEMGKLDGCYDCHLQRSGDDFLFGVPTTARPPHP